MKTEIKVYGAAWCGKCTQLKQKLDARGVEYTYIDVDDDPQVMNALVASGMRGLPVMDINGALFAGMSGLKEATNAQ